MNRAIDFLTNRFIDAAELLVRVPDAIAKRQAAAIGQDYVPRGSVARSMTAVRPHTDPSVARHAAAKAAA